MIIFDKESLEKYIKVSIISVENLPDKNIEDSENKIEYKITLGLKIILINQCECDKSSRKRFIATF